MLRELKCSLCKNEMSCAVMGIGEPAIEKCGMFNLKDPPARTNADRIRQMSDEELAGYLYKHDFCKTPFMSDKQNWCDGDCEKCVADWLKSPVEVDNG